jgi:hypothetical protein
MPSPLIDTPQALDSAIAACRHAHSGKVVRAVRNQRIRTWIALGMSGCVAIGALFAFFVLGDHEAGVISSLIACMTFGFTFLAEAGGQKKGVDSLREMDQLM